MADSAGEDALTARRQLIAVLRLVVEPGGRVLYGEIVDPDSGRESRFVSSSGISEAIEAWVIEALERSRPGSPRAEPERPSGAGLS